MNQKLVAGSVIGLVVGLIIGALTGGFGFLVNDSEAHLSLASQQEQCVWVFKQDGYVKKGKRITFRVHNACSSEVTVALGNFRSQQTTTRTDCANATDGVTWPFKEADDQLSNRQKQVPAGETVSIPLRGAKRSTGSGLDQYYFDACVAGRIVDPRLVIE